MSGVLVSGATTPLGVRLLQRLRLAGRGPLMALGREDDEDALAMLPDGVHYHRVDLTRARDVRQVLYGPVADLGVGALVHLAAHRSALAEGGRVHNLNVEATRLLLHLAEEHPTITRFVHRSSAAVYRNRTDQPDVLREDASLDLDPTAPQWVRDRVEADVTVCARMGLSPLQIVVLRCAEVLCADMGSQLYDYLRSRVCLRPLGYDPMVELLSLDDAARALVLALSAPEPGVYNIPGLDVLPLSRVIRLWGRDEVALPGALLGPAYRLRRAARGTRFRYDLNWWRFHFSAVLDGTRAARLLDYRPESGIGWPAATASRSDGR